MWIYLSTFLFLNILIQNVHHFVLNCPRTRFAGSPVFSCLQLTDFLASLSKELLSQLKKFICNSSMMTNVGTSQWEMWKLWLISVCLTDSVQIIKCKRNVLYTEKIMENILIFVTSMGHKVKNKNFKITPFLGHF